jgi:3-isopropylmalate/(R)-2-methylmalate dehydratase small subunit
MKPIRGRVWKFGNDVNTDVIHPPAFYSLDPEVVKRGLFHGLDPELQPRLAPGDIIVGGRNFGCGSSRETSVQSMKLNRIGAVVAADFARIFFRNATNQGLPCLRLADPGLIELIRSEQIVELSFTDWRLRTDDGIEIALEVAGEFIRKIWQAGGLLSLLPAKPA